MPQKKVSFEGREFKLDALRFSNGCFLSISEGGDSRLGSLTVSTSLGGRAESTTVIPGRFGDISSRILGEAVAKMVGGIAVVSTYLRSEPNPGVFRLLLNEARELLESPS